MSSNFWTSSHSRYHLHPRSSLLASRSLDLQYCTPRQHYCLQIYFAGLLQKLGKRLMLRQLPIATAIVFFKRFYLKPGNAICETNPYLVLAACAYVAAKVEETPVHIKSVVAEAKAVFAENHIKLFPADSSKLGEMEFYLLEDLDFHLVVFHPYRALLAITGRDAADGGQWSKTRVEEDTEIRKAKTGSGGNKSSGVEDGSQSGESEEERMIRLMKRGSGEGLMDIEEGVLQISLFLINDTYRTDLPLLYPPYVIALAALYVGYSLTSANAAANSSNAQSGNASGGVGGNANPPRTRSSTQTTDPSSSHAANAALGLPPPPTAFADFFASFQISLPVLFACVQDLVVLYPIWEAFEPTLRGPGAAGAGFAGAAGRGMFAGSAAAAAAAAQSGAGAGGAPGSRRASGVGTAASSASQAAQIAAATALTAPAAETFTAVEAEALVRRMIEERAVDLSHPDDAGRTGGSKQIVGRKRKA